MATRAAAASAGQSRSLAERDRAAAAVKLGRDHRADDDDRVALQHQNSRRPFAEADRFGEDGAAAARSASGWHHQHAAGDVRAMLRVPAIDDRAEQGSSPPQKLSGSSSSKRRAGAGAGNERRRAERTRAHNRTTLPARAEATHSASDP